MKTKIILISALLLLAFGFLAGRWSVRPKTETVFVQGETVRDTIFSEQLVPYRVEVPARPELPLRPDTIRLPGKPEIIIFKVDTAQIIANYVVANFYRETLFDNQKDGRLIISATVQYNRLSQLSYDFTPMQRVTTIERRRVMEPFLSTSYNTFGLFGVGGGFFYHNLGFSGKYITDFERRGVEVGVKVKF